MVIKHFNNIQVYGHSMHLCFIPTLFSPQRCISLALMFLYNPFHSFLTEPQNIEWNFFCYLLSRVILDTEHSIYLIIQASNLVTCLMTLIKLFSCLNSEIYSVIDKNPEWDRILSWILPLKMVWMLSPWISDYH